MAPVGISTHGVDDESRYGPQVWRECSGAQDVYPHIVVLRNGVRDRGDQVSEERAPHVRHECARLANVRAHRWQLDEAAAAAARRRFDQVCHHVSGRDSAPHGRRQRCEQAEQEADAHASRRVPLLARGGESAAARDDKRRVDRYDGGLCGLFRRGTNSVERLLAPEAVPRLVAPLLGEHVAAMRARRALPSLEAGRRGLHKRRLRRRRRRALVGVGWFRRPALDGGGPRRCLLLWRSLLCHARGFASSGWMDPPSLRQRPGCQ